MIGPYVGEPHSGKWYTSEDVELPEGCHPWAPEVAAAVRIKYMHAVFMEPTPWGFPLMVPSGRTE